MSISQIGTPRSKRSRSSTPSLPEEERPKVPQSPLRKRQKIAASRTSKLKQSINGDELKEAPTPSAGDSSEDEDFLYVGFVLDVPLLIAIFTEMIWRPIWQRT